MLEENITKWNMGEDFTEFAFPPLPSI